MARRRTVETVITFLEMTAPPAEQVAAPVGMKLALMRAPDIPLHFYRYLYDTTGRKHNWVIRHEMTDAALRRVIHKEGVEVWVLYCEGAPAGFYELDFSVAAVVQLVFFGVLECFQGRGLGRYMLNMALREAWRDGPQKVTVNTCTLDHPAALPLYQKAGFEPVGRVETRLPIRER